MRRAWEDSKVPDNADDAWLVVLHWDDFGDHRGVDPGAAVPPKVLQLWEKTPSGGVREFRNRMVILAPSASAHEAMVRSVRTHLALEALAQNAETLAALSADKRKELTDRAKESSLLARVAVCNHVSVLYVPTTDGLDAVELDVVTVASVRPNQTDGIVDRLASMDKTLAAGDKPLDPGYVKTKLGALLDASQPTAELVRAFARRADLKIVLDRAQLVALVTAGIRNGGWEYQDPERGDDGWGTKDHPSVAVRLAEDTFLYPPGSAPAPKEFLCPFCGKSHPGRGCEGGPTPPPPPGHGATTFTGTGSAGKAFTDARAAAADAGRHTLTKLGVTLEHIGPNAGTELARLHTIVAASALDATLLYDIDVTVALSDPADTAAVTYHGTPADYAPLREALKQLLAPRQATLRAGLHVVYQAPLELSGEAVAAIAQAASDTGPTKCQILITTESDA